MSQIMRYLMINAEKGKDLLLQHQAEVDKYGDNLTLDEVQAELTNDKAYLEFIETVNKAF